MKAAVLYGKEDVRVEEVLPKTLNTGEVRVDIKAALTCGTDLKVFKRGYHAKMIVPPAVFGHELAGIISEVAPDVSKWRVGERVVVANSAPCGECFYCKERQENLCDDLLFLNGAYAESIVVPARLVQRNLLPLKDETDFRDAALTEPLACVVQGVEDTKLKADQRVLVIGSGPIGLMFVALAKNIGCNVTLAGRGETRLCAARRLGANQVIDVSGGVDLVDAIKNPKPLTLPSPQRGEGGRRPGEGLAISSTPAQDTSGIFDVVIEAVGKPEVWEAAAQLVRKGGAVNFFGGCPSGTKASFDTGLIHYSNLTLLASFHHTPRTIRRALSFIETGVIRANDFVDGECALSQLPQLFHSMAGGNRAVKTLIRVDG